MNMKYAVELRLQFLLSKVKCVGTYAINVRDGQMYKSCRIKRNKFDSKDDFFFPFEYGQLVSLKTEQFKFNNRKNQKDYE